MKGLKNEFGEKKFFKLIHCVLAKESMQIMVLKHDKSKQGDLYAVFRKGDNSWTVAINMGQKINTQNEEKESNGSLKYKNR
jgi:hypothetical protein